MERIKFVLLFFVILLSFGINTPDSALVRMGFDKPLLFATLLAITISLLAATRHMLLVLLAAAMAIGANLPEEMAEHAGFNRDYLLAGLIAVIIIPSTFGRRPLY